MEEHETGLIKKLIETLESSVAGIFKPRQIVRVGRAETDAEVDKIIRTASAKRIAEDIMAGNIPIHAAPLQLTYQGKTGLTLKASEQPATAQEAIAASQIAETIRKEVNITKAIIHARDTLESDDSPASDTPVDTDWFTRWRDCAGQVSNDEMQNLWGKILAGEVKNPGAFSLRTMEFLRNTSQTEAEKISKLSPFALNDTIWRSKEQKLLEAHGLDYGYLLRMEQLGVISGLDAFGLKRTMRTVDEKRYIQTLIGSDRALIVQADDPQKVLTYPCYSLTPIGWELMTLCNTPTNREYLRQLGQTFVKEGCQVFIAKYRNLAGGGIEWWNEEEILQSKKEEAVA